MTGGEREVNDSDCMDKSRKNGCAFLEKSRGDKIKIIIAC